MKNGLNRYRNSALRRFITRNKKYGPFLFFVGGFIFDSLTLGRIDRLYDLVVLCLYMCSLTLSLYFYNLAGDRKWENSWLSKYEVYFPLIIQFFFGGLSSAFVIYFARSVSLSRTFSFFCILIFLLVANEFLKKRIANKYLQFGLYFFVSFTFFTFIIPVFVKEVSTTVFLVSGLLSLLSTLAFVVFIHKTSPSTQKETSLAKLMVLILGIYLTINAFYFLKLIPPVPLALQNGIIASHIEKKDNAYLVTFQAEDWFIFWRRHQIKHPFTPGEKVYAFTSVFAPTEINQEIFHRWRWFNPQLDEWQLVDTIGYKITGGRDEGYRGYTYKENIQPGLWEVIVNTENGMVLGVIQFEAIEKAQKTQGRIVTKAF